MIPNDTTEMAATSKTDNNNAFCACESDIMRNAMQSRRVGADMPHLIPILDALPSGAFVLEVGCGPGGITLSIAQKYPQLQVLGIDIDRQSIKVRMSLVLECAGSLLKWLI